MHPMPTPSSRTEPSERFVLSTPSGPAPLLERVDVQAEVDAVLSVLTLQQSWRNAGTQPVEALYTFALPPRGLLLAFAVTRGPQRLEGTILPRAKAEARYEQALARGDAPTLLERGPDGLYTASLGNLLPGQTARLELRFAQVLRLEQGQIRLVIPTAVAPRYGDPSAAGLAPYQTPLTSIGVEYPLSLSLSVSGSLADADLSCPTHPHQLTRSAGVTRVVLDPGARMDRDVVVVLQPHARQGALLVCGPDPLAPQPQHVALAAFELPPRQTHRPLSLKLLVDCSGSMGGDSIASARRALAAVADQLGADDEVALVRFGSAVDVALAPRPCTSGTLSALRRLIDLTDASMGGTEVEPALQATLALRHDARQAELLMITDGQVWQSQALGALARQSRQRIFAIGVGSAPAEGVLRELTEASGGACEFVTPGESLPRAVLRMLERMRSAPGEDIAVDWGCEPLWQAPLTAHACGGDTVIAMARFAGQTVPQRVTLRCGPQPEDVRVTPGADVYDGEVLARLVAERQRLTLSRAEAQATAVRYRLLTEHTHCVLVHPGDPRGLTVPAELVRVPSMLAAGWGGSASVAVRRPALACRSLDDLDGIPGTSDPAAPVHAQEPDSGLSVSQPEVERPPLPSALDLLPAGALRQALAQWLDDGTVLPPWRDLLDSLRELFRLTQEDSWLLIVQESLQQSEPAWTAPPWLQQRLAAIDRVAAAGGQTLIRLELRDRQEAAGRADRLLAALKR